MGLFGFDGLGILNEVLWFILQPPQKKAQERFSSRAQLQ